MGDKISQLPSATSLAGTESVPVVQDGATKKAAAALFKTTNAADLTTGTISNARLPVGNQSQVGALQIGTVAGTACDGADSRLSNSRTPIGGAGGDLIGSYPNPVLTNTGVTAGIYGSATVVPQITIDAKGRIGNAASVSIPIPQAATATPLPTGTPSVGNSDKFAREDHVHQQPSTTLTGDVTGSGIGSLAATLATVPTVTPGTYGSSSRIPIVQVDSKGRVITANTVPVASGLGGTVTSVSGDGGSTGLSLTGGPIVDVGTLTIGGTLNIDSGGTGSSTASGALAALGGVPLSLVGVSSGVASLDASGLVPVSQLPNMVTGSYATLDGNGKVPLNQLYTASINGLATLDGSAKVPLAQLPAGTSGGIATLDGSGKVPSGQLPSYVDDVVEVANFAALPNPGETGKIYVTLDTNLTYRWTGSTYVEISAGPTPSSTTPLIAGTAAVGTSLTYARADHVHPAQAVPVASSSTPLVASGTGQIGSLTTYARADHVHPAQTISNIDGGSPSAVGGLIQMRRGTSALWTSANPVLSSGEVGFETDTKFVKIGDGTLNWQSLSYIRTQSQSYAVDVLIVAGGGGGGRQAGGGGGAGGYRTTTGIVSETASYPIVVGAGGPSQAIAQSPSVGSGTVSTAFSLTSTGGGGGAGYNNNTGSSFNGASGGSGGGCWSTNTAGTGTSGQGNNGGVGLGGGPFSELSGGGGGASAVGESAVTGTRSGNGGAGTDWLNGVTYAGGGGGGSAFNGTATNGTGGSGGGGAGGNKTSINGVSGTANTGGGGGGSGYDGSPGNIGTPGNGGSGVVVLRYSGPQRGTGGTISQAGGYTYHTFNSSGTFVA